MLAFTIETTYRLPIYRQRTYEAETAEQACGLAIADEGWDEKSGVDTSGDTYVTGIWEGRDVAYCGKVLPIPSQFGELIQRKAEHFEVLLGRGLILRERGPLLSGGGSLLLGTFETSRLYRAMSAFECNPEDICSS